MRIVPVLSDNPLLRLSTVTALYFCQGVPAALFYLVIPSWMAANGASAAEIATVTGASALPPTFKFLAALFMDRFAYLPMGRRKPWILFGQALILGSLIAGSLYAGNDPAVTLLATIGFLSLAGFAFQDVAVDGLIIDLFDESERARAAGFAYGAATLGMALLIGLGGRLVASEGLAVMFAVLAVLPLVVFLAMLPLREREGEKLTPWTCGSVHLINRQTHAGNWRVLLGNLFRALLSPLAILLMVVCAARTIHMGVGDALHGMMAIRGAGWPMTRFTDLQTGTTLASGIGGIVFGGFVVTRLGPRKSLLLLIPMLAAIYASMALWPDLRSDDTTLTAFLYTYDILTVFGTVAIFPICMRMCSPTVAATQFAIFMAAMNLGRPLGASISATLGLEGLTEIFLLIAAIHLVLALVFLLIRFPDRSIIERPGDGATER